MKAFGARASTTSGNGRQLRHEQLDANLSLTAPTRNHSSGRILRVAGEWFLVILTAPVSMTDRRHVLTSD